MAIARKIDMHVHTTASDGQYSPEKVVEMAAQLGLAGVAITDHDTTAGITEAMQAAEKHGIILLPGIEISTVADGQDIHVLGYFTDNDDEQWQQRLLQLGATREARNAQLLDKLNELGIAITMDEVQAVSGDVGSVGRPHFAQVLVEKGFVQNKQQAFDEYLGEQGKAFVQPLRIHPSDAYQWIRDAGGVCVLAHPGIYHNEALVEQLLIAGPDGVEVNHSDHTPDQVQRYLELAEQYVLIATAGSDFHGHGSDGSSFHGGLGSVTADISVYEQLLAIHQKRAGRTS